jgi:hypothetical protein
MNRLEEVFSEIRHSPGPIGLRDRGYGRSARYSPTSRDRVSTSGEGRTYDHSHLSAELATSKVLSTSSLWGSCAANEGSTTEVRFDPANPGSSGAVGFDPVNEGSSTEVGFDPAAAGPADIAITAITDTTQRTTRMRFKCYLPFSCAPSQRVAVWERAGLSPALFGKVRGTS